MATLTNQTLATVTDVMSFMSPYAGGSIPDSNSTDYADWLRWIQVKQEEFAVRGFWRRLLKHTTLTITSGVSTTTLPDDFHKPNGLYVLEVGGVDWAESNNSAGMSIFVEYDMLTTSPTFGKWLIHWADAPTATETGTLWYFANPPKPTAGGDKIILPGDMVGYGALTEYFRVANQEGSMDKAEQDAENRFNTYISMEMIPAKYELLSFASRGSTRIDRLDLAKNYYRSRVDRNTQL